MKIKEIMITDVKSLKPDDNALGALKLLFEMRMSGLPVIDSQKKLVGMFTEKNVLSYILPSYLEKIGKFIYDSDLKSTKRKFTELAKLKVSQLMRREVITAKEDFSLSEAAKDMLLQKARRIPVVDETGKVLGIISRCDILKALIKEAEGEREAKK
ncbi:MAG: CBS domain-containing protein [Candidatus Omnitrophota bacterium]|nr:CBS domain-containing protein [Candidatus Omnitrophota bacterium]